MDQARGYRAGVYGLDGGTTFSPLLEAAPGKSAGDRAGGTTFSPLALLRCEWMAESSNGSMGGITFSPLPLLTFELMAESRNGAMGRMTFSPLPFPRPVTGMTFEESLATGVDTALQPAKKNRVTIRLMIAITFNI